MEKYFYWQSDEVHGEYGELKGVLIPAHLVYEGVSTFGFDFVMFFPELKGGENKNKFKVPDNLFQNTRHRNEVEEILESLVGSYCIASEVEYEEARDVLCFDFENEMFFSLDDCESEYCFDYRQNGDPRTLILGDDVSYEIEYNGECFDLDIKDERGYYYYPEGATGYHAALWVVEIDGEKDLFWYEWAGQELDGGYIMPRSKILELLANHPEIEEIKKWIKINFG